MQRKNIHKRIDIYNLSQKKSHNVYVNKACECIGCHRKLWVEEGIIIFISTWIPVLQISSSQKTDSLNLHTIHQLYMCRQWFNFLLVNVMVTETAEIQRKMVEIKIAPRGCFAIELVVLIVTSPTAQTVCESVH